MAFNATPESIIEQNVNGLLQIHSCWTRVPLALIANVQNGFAFKSSFFNNGSEGERIIRIRDVLPGDTKTYYSGVIPDGYWVSSGDIIVGMDGDFNLALWRSKPALLNQRVCHLDVTSQSYDRRFFYQMLPGYLEAINLNTSSTTVKHLSSKTLNDLLLPLPSIAEQKVIADKLDNLLAQVENTKARLEHIPKILKRFRQSVLAAAVSGRLTEEWRRSVKNHDFESFEIPESWTATIIGAIADVKGGKRLPKGEELVPENTGFPYIRAGQLKNGTVIVGDDGRNAQFYITESVRTIISRYTVNSGDAYITIVGASIGDAGIIPDSHDKANLTENAAKITNFKVALESKYLSIWLRSEYLQELISRETKSAAQGKLALSRIKTLPFPCPPIDEQTEIVRQVDRLFAHADRIEQQVNNALARVNNLTQSILAKAFRGGLTEQWRKDNPELISGENSAEALLERMKTERAKHTSNKIKKVRA